MIQKTKPNILPVKVQNWDFLPHYLNSLEPYDKIIRKYFVCYKNLLKKSNKPVSSFDNLVTSISAKNSQEFNVDKETSLEIRVLPHSNLYKINELQNYQFY